MKSDALPQDMEMREGGRSDSWFDESDQHGEEEDEQCHTRCVGRGKSQQEKNLDAERRKKLNNQLYSLRAQVMYLFLDRLINLGFPRTMDFQGVSPNSFDGHGNYSIGMRDQTVFPEIRYEALGRNRGMDVCITMSASTDNEAQRLLALLGMPFRQVGGPTIILRGKRKKAHDFDAKAKGKNERK